MQLNPQILVKLKILKTCQIYTELDLLNADCVEFINLQIFASKIHPYIDYSLNFNKIETNFIQSNAESEDEVKHIIIYNLYTIIKPIINSTTYQKLILAYDPLPHIVLPLRVINSICGFAFKKKMQKYIDTVYIQKIKKKNINMKVEEFRVCTNIILTTLHRCSLIKIINNAKKNKISEDLRELDFTDGTTLVFNQDILYFLKKIVHLNKYPTNYSKVYDMVSLQNNAESLYTQSVGGVGLWIQKKNTEIDFGGWFKQAQDVKVNTRKLIEVINHQNQTQYKISVLEIAKLIHQIKKNINLDVFLETTKKNNKLVNTQNKASKITYSYDYSKPFTVVDNEAINNIMELLLVENFINNSFNAEGFVLFYLNHRLDLRGRMYVWEWPINYQLNRLVRGVIQIKQQLSLDQIYNNLFNHPIYIKYKKHITLWQFKELTEESLNKAINFFNTNSKINLNKNNHFLLESLVRLIIEYSNTKNGSVDYRFNLGFEVVSSLNLFEFKLKPSEGGFKTMSKTDFEAYKLHKNLLSVFEGDLDVLSFPDASCSALQIQTLTRGGGSSFLFKLLNLKENNTDYKNIYAYVADKYKEINLNTIVPDLHIPELYTIELAKSYTMPASYGKKLNTCYKTTDRYLFNISENWNKLTKTEKHKINELLYKKTFDSLKEIGLDILGYIKDCRDTPKSAEDRSDLGLPYVFYPQKIKTRGDIRRNIKETKQVIYGLQQQIKDVNYNTPNSIKQLQKQIDLKETKLKKLNQELSNHDKIVKKISCSIYNKKLRYQFIVPEDISKKPDKNRSKNADPVNAIHSRDSSILINCLSYLKDIGLHVCTIHDSIGVPIGALPIVTLMYRIAMVETLLDTNSETSSLVKCQVWPYTDKLITFSGLKIPEDVIKSHSLFC